VSGRPASTAGRPSPSVRWPSAAAGHNAWVLDADALLALARRPLLIGVGGGGDVAATLALAEPLRRLHGARPTVGGVSWERIAVDRHPGPRRIFEIAGAASQLAPAAVLAGPATRVSAADGGEDMIFAESRAAALGGERTVLVDPTGGPAAVAEGLGAAIDHLDADLLVLVDVGGDAIAHGDEPGLSSPLCDAVLLAAGAALAEQGVNVLGAVFGSGCDGELSLAEVMARLAEIARGGGLAGTRGLTEPSAAELERAVAAIPTEASAIPLRCFRGETGTVAIRGGRRQVELSPLCALTFFFDVGVAVETAARLARAVRRSSGLEAANDVLHELGVRTELDLERATLA
jgi:hypothetical protein